MKYLSNKYNNSLRYNTLFDENFYITLRHFVNRLATVSAICSNFSSSKLDAFTTARI